MTNKEHEEASIGLANLAELGSDEERIIFTPNASVGFSIKKEYPDHVKFSRLERKDGGKDSVCLIRISYKDFDGNAYKNIFIDCSHQSRFLLDHQGLSNDFDHSVPDYPTEESISRNVCSRIPFTITTRNKYRFNLENKTFFEIKTQKQVTLRKIIDDVFEAHLASCKFFRWWFLTTLAKLNISLFSIGEFIGYCVLLHWLGGYVYKDDIMGKYKGSLGATYDKEDFTLRMVELNERNQSEDLNSSLKENVDVEIPFFSGKIEVHRRGLTASILALATLAILNWQYNLCFWIIDLLKEYEGNAMILATLAIVWVYLFNIIFKYFFPWVGMRILNFVIAFTRRIYSAMSIRGFDFEFPLKNFRS